MMIYENREETKECPRCKKKFAVQSRDGNPFTHCRYCRGEKWDELQKLAIKRKNNENQ